MKKGNVKSVLASQLCPLSSLQNTSLSPCGCKNTGIGQSKINLLFWIIEKNRSFIFFHNSFKGVKLENVNKFPAGLGNWPRMVRNRSKATVKIRQNLLLCSLSMIQNTN